MLFVIFYVYSMIVTTEASLAKTASCKLPQSEKDFDWEKVPKDNWYQILNVGDILDEAVSCFGAKNFRKTDFGGVYDFVVDVGNAKQHTVEFKFHREGLNRYIRYRDEDQSFIYDMKNARKQHHLEDKSMDSDANIYYKFPQSYYSDYKSYIIVPQCGFKGKHFLWVLTRTPSPSATDLIKITTVIEKMGNEWAEVPLYMSGCPALDGNNYMDV
ncbi:uncharacterized protein LOC120335948 isoform X1 [Styela clava]